MNKLMGFYELRNSCLPSIQWKVFDSDTVFSDEYLWTIRSAVFDGNDLNLPRLVGAQAEDALSFAQELQEKLGDRGMVVYYPYFIAEKSGTIEIKPSGVIIEAVEKIYGIWLLSLNEMLRCTMI